MHLPDGREIAARDVVFADLYAELAWIHSYAHAVRDAVAGVAHGHP
jgi:hypothetical protein